MENPCLHDKNIYPDDEVLTGYLGKAKVTWDSFGELIKIHYPLLATEWRYYNDGKTWLCKVTKKTKTMCWIGIYNNYFRVTFYFSGKAEEAITNSALDEPMKQLWLHNENGGKFRPITLEVKKKSDLKAIKKLLELKLHIN
jgi:hypothetical protein